MAYGVVRAVSVVRLAIVAVAITLLAAACGSSPTSQGANTTDESNGTTTTTVPTVAALRAGPVNEWAGAPVTSVCIRTDETYPQVPEFRMPIAQWADQLLTNVGVTAVAADAPCDAILTVTVYLEGLSAEYGPNATTYFTGHHRKVDITLEAEGQAPITASFPHDSEPLDIAPTSDPQTPQAFLESAQGDIAKPLLDTSVRIWGPALAVEAICTPYTGWPAPNFPWLAQQALIDVSGMRDTYTTQPSPSDYASWRLWFETGQRVEGTLGSGCPVRT